MVDFNTNFWSTNGFRAIKSYENDADKTGTTDKKSTAIFTAKQISSYIPIISTIVGLVGLIFLARHLENPSVKRGFIFRSICEILYLAPILLILDTIVNIGRLCQYYKQKKSENSQATESLD